MECQASLKSICQTFEVFNHDKIAFSSVRSKKMYPVIIDAFNEYRYIFMLKPLIGAIIVKEKDYNMGYILTNSYKPTFLNCKTKTVV